MVHLFYSTKKGEEEGDDLFAFRVVVVVVRNRFTTRGEHIMFDVRKACVVCATVR
jgi:hypothetical protein